MTLAAMEEDHDSDGKGEGEGSERRSAPRITARSLVEVRLPTWDALRSVYTVNISQGGMRLSIGARAPIGTVIDIILTLPDGTRLHLPGKVAHLGPSESGDLGVRFDDLPDRTRQEIERYLEELSAGRTPTSKTKSIPPGVLIKKKR
jgi:Tfp pilus assembly protein PilZ